MVLYVGNSPGIDTLGMLGERTSIGSSPIYCSKNHSAAADSHLPFFGLRWPSRLFSTRLLIKRFFHAQG
jgi:hypothetical protein